MKKQLIHITLIFMIIITIVMLFYSKQISKSSEDDFYQTQLVDINEIVQLSKKNDEKNQLKLEQAISEFKHKQVLMKRSSTEKEQWKEILILYSLCILFLFLIFAYVYRAILRPFDKLQAYANEIAKGNFDIDLKYERTNYFGKFTWAFDHMRKEIKRARACEKEAIDNNKTVIATLSHDIKTPIASIRAYAEGLDANLDSGPEMRRKYSCVIIRKCEEVTKLTNDLFLHSLSDLNKLQINTGKINLRVLFNKMLSELQLDDGLISVTKEIPDVDVMLDEKRFEQVIENLINNAKKYAPDSRIDISAETMDEVIIISVRDYGQGIPDEDVPFIFEKFYRGRNAGNRQGSGLGLYIVKYIMEQLGGTVSLQNTSCGLNIILQLPYSS